MDSNTAPEIEEIRTTFEEDIETFRTLNTELAGVHRGKFLLVKNGQNKGIFSSFEDAHKEAIEKYGIADVVIGQIGVDPPLNYIASVI